MIYLDSVAVQAKHEYLRSGNGIYNAQQLAQWILQSWTGVGSLSLELLKGSTHGTLLERYMCRLTLAYIMNTKVEEAWDDFVSVMESTERVETNETCPICYEEVGSGSQLKCGHMFHEKCIGTWFMKKTTCPMCRYDVIKGHI